MYIKTKQLGCALLLACSLAAQQRPQPPARTAAAKGDLDAVLSRAAELADAGKLGAARAEYERALRAGAGAALQKDADHARRIGLVYLNGTPQHLENASTWLGIAHGLRPGDDDTALHYAQSLAWSGRNAEAIKEYGALQQKHPNNADYVIGMANALFANDQAETALVMLERFTQNVPSNTPVRILYARFLGYSKQYVQSLAQYQAVLQADPTNLDALIGIAKVNSWQGDNGRALEQFDAVLRRAPRNYDALVGKAYALLWLGRKTEARELFVTINERNPADREIAATLKSLPAPKVVAVAKPAAPAKPSPETIIAPEPEPAAAPQIVAKLEPPPVEPSAAPPTTADQAAALIEQAKISTDAGNYAEAIHRYHEVLALDPGNRAAMLQIARLLSWSKSYSDSVSAYEEVLAKDPYDVATATERARVLSWAKRFPESLAAYQAALEALGKCDSSACPSERSLRIEYARVLSWSGKYADALAQYDQLKLEPTNMDDRAAMLDRGRTLAWAKRYPEAAAQFDAVSQAGGDTFDARLGKAQVTYWSGNVRDAAVQLRRLSVEKPKDPTVALTLAAVEHNLGYNARALSLLSVAEPGVEANSLRETIRQDLRPLLRIRYGYEDDVETESNATQSTIKALRYSSAVEFNIHPDVRMEVANIITNTLTSNSLLGKHSSNNLAQETLARLNFRVRPGFFLTVGGGVGTTGGDNLHGKATFVQHPLFEVHPVFTIKKTRIDIALARRIAEYTPLAISDNVVQTRLTSSLIQSWKQLRFGAEYWHGHYSVRSPETGLPTRFTTEGDGGALSVAGTAFRSEKMTADLGMRYESFGFDQGGLAILRNGTGIGSAGFFTPRLYQRYSGTANLVFTPRPSWRINLGGTLGPQRVFGYGELSPPPANWGTTGSLDAGATYSFRNLALTAGYGFFSTETASLPGQSSGGYDSHAATFQLTYRF